jgi:hypothetical protein
MVTTLASTMGQQLDKQFLIYTFTLSQDIRVTKRMLEAA